MSEIEQLQAEADMSEVETVDGPVLEPTSEWTYTPGPWRWELNLNYKSIQLCGGVPRHDLTVMDFVRWGMSGAAPRLREMSGPRLNIMARVEKFAKIVLGREHHASWFQDIDHPDARLIAAAPELLEACKIALKILGDETLDRSSPTNRQLEEFDVVLHLTHAIAKAEGKT